MGEPERDGSEGTPAIADAPSGAVIRRHAEQLMAVVDPVVGVARDFSGYFLTAGLVSTLAAATLVLALVATVDPETVWGVVLTGFVGVMLMLPGLILLIFWVGLRQLIAIPSEVADSIGDLGDRGLSSYSRTRTGTGSGGRMRRLLGLLRSLVDVRESMLQSRDVFAKGLVLLRVANPVSLVVVLAATLASMVITVVGAMVALGVVF